MPRDVPPAVAPVGSSEAVTGVSHGSELPTSDDDSGSDLCMSNSKCPCCRCEYGPGDIIESCDKHTHFKCSKCSDSNSNWWICAVCANMKIHQRHPACVVPCFYDG